MLGILLQLVMFSVVLAIALKFTEKPKKNNCNQNCKQGRTCDCEDKGPV